MRSVFLIVALLLGIAGWQAGLQPVAAQDQANQDPAAPTVQGDDYVLGAGDQIRVTVFGHPDLSGQFQVGTNGRVSLPLVGEIKASGLSVQNVEQEIVNRLQPDYLKSPNVSVEVLNYRPFYILGEVNQPGSYPYVNGMRIINAVALAGGYTYRADEADLWVTRTDGTRERAKPTTQVFPGDVIEVPERFF
ncbi:MAG: polysaccharide biosynthesis/export family protein [Kiloniellales bacterium]